MVAKIIKSQLESLINMFFPPRCVSCGVVLEWNLPLCTNCQFNLPFTKQRFGRQNESFYMLQNLCEIENAFSFLWFDKKSITQKLLHDLKYRGREDIGITLGKLFLRDLSQQLEIAKISSIIPVPLHTKKMNLRGYNQIDSFAETIAESLHIPMIRDLLIRVQNNSSQVTKNREERLLSLKNSFRLSSLNSIENQHVLLLDDVITTGATISHCVNQLNLCENVKVSVATIAIAR